MIDEDGSDPNRDAGSEALLYDWFKHLTSISLLTLGGILTLSGLTDDAEIKKPILAGVLVVVAVAGVLAFSGAAQIVKARAAGEPLPGQVLALQKWVPFVLSMGVGAFLYIYVRAMS